MAGARLEKILGMLSMRLPGRMSTKQGPLGQSLTQPVAIPVIDGQSFVRAQAPLVELTDLPSDLEAPVTIFKLPPKGSLNAETLRSWHHRLQNDNEFSQSYFTRQIIFVGGGVQQSALEHDAIELLQQWQIRFVLTKSQADVPTGPYYLLKNAIYNVWRVREDPNLAFVQSTWYTDTTSATFHQASLPGSGYRAHGIAVGPKSSLWQDMSTPKNKSESDEVKPLLGQRLAVKDNYDLKGITTSLCNRAFFEMQNPSAMNAAAVSSLLKAGVQIVGKTYMSSFAMMEHPTQSTDFQASFNPRGDGYQITGGSSGGSAAAVAAYDWIDLALCSDTTGSARIPALQTGIFAFRSSTHLIPCEGLAPAWPYVDAISWFGRNLETFPDILATLCEGEKPAFDSDVKPRVLYISDFGADGGSAQAKCVKKLIDDLNSVLDQPVQVVSVHDDWKASSPKDIDDIDVFFENATEHGWYYSAYHSFDMFRSEYEKANGKPPYVSEVVRWYWKLGKEVKPQQYQTIIDRFEIFRDWFLKTYMPEQAENTLVLLDIDKIKPKYRDEYPGDANPNVPGLRATFISAILGAPEVTIPIDQISYRSRITNREEMLPVAISVMGARNKDHQLLHTVVKLLQDADRATVVKTGSVAF